MEIYLVSLNSDLQRREHMANSFVETYPKMRCINAINGKELSAKEYFFYAQHYFKAHKKIITPSEVGCTLSHIKALESFLKTKEEYALILEDDVYGDDQSICFIENMLKKNKLDGVLLCGGQVPMDFDKYRLYKKITESIFIIPNFSKKFFFGTCCYAVNKKNAKLIIDYQKNNFTKADCWNEVLGDSIKLYYMNVLQHPFEMNNSHIENERSIFYMDKNNFFKRIYKQGVFWKVYNRIINDICRWILILKGYRQIPKNK